MTLTYIEKFNNYLKLFINELINIYPEYNEKLTTNYKSLLDSENNNEDTFVKHFNDEIKQYTQYIAKKDDSLFKLDKELNFIKGIDSRDLWFKDISQKTKNNIWKYLQTLIVLSKKIIGDDEEINNLIENFQNSEEFNMDNIKKETENMMEMLQNLSMNDNSSTEDNNSSNENSNPLDNLAGGLIGDIAKELTEELNINESDIGEPRNMNEAFNNLLGGNGGQGNFLNIISKVGEKIQNKVNSGQINQNDLMKEAQQMMGSLKNPNHMAQMMRQQQKANNPTKDRLRKKLEERKK